MTKLSNVKEKVMNTVERNRYTIVYGACCAGCVLIGYALGKRMTDLRIGTALNNRAIANPKLIDELKVASNALTDVNDKVNKL